MNRENAVFEGIAWAIIILGMALLAAIIFSGCQTYEQPTCPEYRQAVVDVSRPMLERQRLWQEMRKACYGI